MTKGNRDVPNRSGRQEGQLVGAIQSVTSTWPSLRMGRVPCNWVPCAAVPLMLAAVVLSLQSALMLQRVHCSLT